MIQLRTATRVLLNGLVDPVSSLRCARDRDGLSVVWPLAFGLAAVLGVGTLPCQIAMLQLALPSVGDAMLAAQHEQVRAGLTRLIIADRVFVAPTVLLAGMILSAGLDGVLGLPADRRGRIWAVVGVGLAPLLLERLGELVITYAMSARPMSPGDVINLPHRFTTGARLGWWRGSVPPAWLEVLDARLSVITLWTATLWGLGIRELERDVRIRRWHIMLPIGCLGVAGVVTWALGPLMVALILRGG